MDPFEWTSTETEQIETHQGNSQTISQESRPVITPEIGRQQKQQEPAPRWESDKADGQEALARIPTELAYSCLLIPRFSDHYLTGDITEDLVTWMKEICVSYGWRLEAIAVRPGYLQWAVTVPLTANPAQVMRLTRHQTSQKIFEDYPRFKRKNLSPDFWAPGFLIAPGERLYPLETINSFILEVRRQQGLA